MSKCIAITSDLRVALIHNENGTWLDNDNKVVTDIIFKKKYNHMPTCEEVLSDYYFTNYYDKLNLISGMLDSIESSAMAQGIVKRYVDIKTEILRNKDKISSDDFTRLNDLIIDVENKLKVSKSMI